MDEFKMEPRPAEPVFKEDLHHVQVTFSNSWGTPVPEVICNDPDHKLNNGNIDCLAKDLVSETGWEAFSVDDEKRVLFKFGIKLESEHVSAAPHMGELGYDIDELVIQQAIPIEEES